MWDKTMVQTKFKLEAFYKSVEKKNLKDCLFEGHSHEFWEILYVVDGEVEVTEEGNVYKLREGDLILHPPMTFHRNKGSGGTALTIINLSFWGTGDFLRNLLSGVFHLDGVERKEFLAIYKSVADFLDNEVEEAYFGQEVADRLTTFMLRLGRTNVAQHKKVSAEGVDIYKRLVEIMNNEVHSNLSIAELAERMFMSVSYVKVLFSRYAGVSPKTYYTNLRINESKKMLSDGKKYTNIYLDTKR